MRVASSHAEFDRRRALGGVLDGAMTFSAFARFGDYGSGNLNGIGGATLTEITPSTP